MTSFNIIYNNKYFWHVILVVKQVNMLKFLCILLVSQSKLEYMFCSSGHKYYVKNTVSTQGLYFSLIMLGCQDVEAVVDALGNLTIWFYKLTVPGI